MHNPYRSGNFRPLPAERARAETTILGALPEDLRGVYLRNGPNARYAPSGGWHMFDGAGMVHSIHLSDGAATASSRYVRTPRWDAEESARRDLYLNVGDLAGGGPKALGKLAWETLRMRSGLLPKLDQLGRGTASTALMHHHGALYALQEVSWPFRIGLRRDEQGHVEIDGRGKFDDFAGRLTTAFSAHPKIDPQSDEVFSVSLSGRPVSVSLAKLGADGELLSCVELDTPKQGPGFIHDSFLTPSSVIWMDPSLRFEPKGFFEPGGSPWKFDRDRPLRFGVVPRDAGSAAQVRWFETDAPGFAWHTVNGWERRRDDGTPELVLYAPVFDDYPGHLPIHLQDEPPARLTQWVIDLRIGKVTRRVLMDDFVERPRIDESRLGTPTRYVYLLDKTHPRGVMGCGVRKYDLIEEREVARFSYGEAYGGEPLFVPRQGRAEDAEDDGYLLELLMTEERAELLVLSAKDLQELARVKLPYRIPFGVHGLWLNEQTVNQVIGSA